MAKNYKDSIQIKDTCPHCNKEIKVGQSWRSMGHYNLHNQCYLKNHKEFNEFDRPYSLPSPLTIDFINIARSQH